MDYTTEDRSSDFKWFVENYDALYQQYGHKFLAIKNKKVLGAYNGYGPALEDIGKEYQLGTFIVQECNGDASGYTASFATPLFFFCRGI